MTPSSSAMPSSQVPVLTSFGDTAMMAFSE
jgi:hypothetical protein